MPDVIPGTDPELRISSKLAVDLGHSLLLRARVGGGGGRSLSANVSPHTGRQARSPC